jgi:hypothetical protein
MIELKKEESSRSGHEGEAARELPTCHKVSMSPAHAPVKSASFSHRTRSRFVLITLIHQSIRKKELVHVVIR